MNVVLKLFALQPGRHSPAETLAGFGPRMAKSGCFPFLCFLLSPSNGAARFVAGVGTPKPGRSAHCRNAAQVAAWGGRRFEV